MDDAALQQLIEDATFDHTMGDTDAAVAKLTEATVAAPQSFDAWHTLAEVCFQARRLDEALRAGEAAHALRPDDLLINTTLSRIWMERGDKTTAERYGARAKVLGWQERLREAPGKKPGDVL